MLQTLPEVHVRLVDLHALSVVGRLLPPPSSAPHPPEAGSKGTHPVRSLITDQTVTVTEACPS